MSNFVIEQKLMQNNYNIVLSIFLAIIFFILIISWFPSPIIYIID